jgi:predicted Zn finger-like uncharacterized protein
MHLGENLQTTCLHCGSVFRITQQQLDAAHGQARCSQCNQVFNALFTLDNLQETPSPPPAATVATASAAEPVANDHDEQDEKLAPRQLSLREAMYGDGLHSGQSGLRSMLWVLGILLLVIISLIQLIYYQRYPLIASSSYQQQVLNLCRLLPCDPSRFSSLAQIRLIERNVFTHPTRDKALMISGSFVNKAPFEQAIPGLLISLSDVQGNLIGSRRFSPSEYLVDQGIKRLASGKPVQFRLEIADPGTQALTYEFEFVDE